MDKYIVNKIIGEGSFGKAILVKSKHNGEQYVVKEIGISKMKPKEKDEARKEVTVLSKMRHPNIVQYTESFEENGKLFIVMEYCEGGDLYALINKQKGIPFKEQQVLNWFVQLCLALKHVHDRKILHRDIKTSNIFLTKSGTIKLGDFGIARVLNNTMELARTCIGTPYYLSPEICENKPYNNKSDVWALGCVVYETLTLKHAFEAGNMKNLVLKIIRGSYPPIPSRYSYDLRTLVSQLFRRNPRERPSINSILRKPFLSSLTEQFLSPQQHDEEFSHTVLHKGRPKSTAYKPSYGARYQPVAAKRMQNLEVRGGAVGVRNRRDHQIAAAYGPSLAAKKQKPVVSRISKASHDKEDFLEKRRRQLLEEEKKRKNALNEEKKKKLENLQKRQRERALKLKEEQMKRARDEARVQNLKRSAELWDHKANGEPDANLKKQILAANVRDRPVSAPRERGDYDKYHQYLNRLEAGDKNAAANIAAPGLNRVKEAWEERVKNQDAVMLAAKVNRAAGERAAGQAHLVSEYLQRKHEAMMNKNRGAIQMQKNVPVKNPNVGVAGALKPYSGADDRIGNERKYLARLEQIRQQNYQDRKVLHQKYMEHKNAYKVEVPLSSEDDDEVRKRKVEALQQQAGDRAKIIKENMERRREMLDENDRNKGNVGQKMKNHDAMARARGIIPPDERPVKYNPNPISITQALHAVGAPIPQKTEAPSPFMPSEIPPPLIDEMMSPSRADPRLKKKVLQRVNQRFSVDYEDDQRAENEKENMRGGEKDDVTGQSRDQEVKTSSRPLPKLPEKPATEESESRPSSAWQARRNEADVVNKILGLPLQDTKSLLEGTVSPPVPPHAPDVKRHWAVPSGTVVRHLNEMALQEPTMTVVETSKDEIENKTKTIERPLPKLKSELSPEKPISEVQTPSKEFSAGEPGSLVEKATLSPDNSNLNAANNKETPERLLAANFQPSNRNGTYVISSLSVTERGDVKESLDEGKENSAAIKNPVNSSVDKLLSASEENKKAEIKTGNIVKSGDVDDDVEEVEFVNEVKSSVKADVSQTAWGEEPSKSNESQVKPEKPLIQSLETRDKKQSPLSKSSSSPKPVLTPQPSLSSAPPTRSNRSSYSQDTLKLSGSTLDKSATKSGSMSGSANRLLFSSGSPTPLITKVNENQAKSPAPSTDHQTENLDKSDPTPLRKSLYSTANDQVIMKLTLGAFDSPYPKLLRTCSLPDLSSDAKNPRDKQNISDEDEAPAEESMNDTNFDDVLEEVGNANEIPDVEDPDEDELSEFCANLQSVLDNSSKPDSSSHPFATELSESMRTLEDEDNSCSEDDDVKIREDWQSDSCSESSSCSEDISDTESVFSRLEDNREELERELGLDKFKKAYRYVQATHEDEDESVRECEERIRAVLGEKHDILYPKILQLVMADGAYCEDNS